MKKAVTTIGLGQPFLFCILQGGLVVPLSILTLAYSYCLDCALFGVDYQNSDLPVVVPFNLTSRLGRGTYLVSVGHGKKPLGAIEVDMMQ